MRHYESRSALDLQQVRVRQESLSRSRSIRKGFPELLLKVKRKDRVLLYLAEGVDRRKGGIGLTVAIKTKGDDGEDELSSAEAKAYQIHHGHI